jgi:hypothetical protein
VELVISLFSEKSVFPGSQALYIFRIFRVLKLVNIISSWKSFRALLKTAWNALLDMRNFLVLLGVYLTITSILGTQLFAYKIMFNKNTQRPISEDPKYPSSDQPRLRRLRVPSLELRQLLELSRQQLLDPRPRQLELPHVRDIQRPRHPGTLLLTSQYTDFYFVSLVILGNLVLLNLFLAILINNFTQNRQQEHVLAENVLTFSLKGLVATVSKWLAKFKKEENKEEERMLEDLRQRMNKNNLFSRYPRHYHSEQLKRRRSTRTYFPKN